MIGERTEGGVRYTAAQKWTLTAVVLASSLMVADMMIVAVGLPAVAEDLADVSLSRMQWIIVAYSLAFGALIQPAGALSDRLGGRRMFMVGISAFTVASVACGLAPSMVTLIAFRAVQGVAASVMFANAMPLIARCFDAERRTMAIAIWSGAVGIAAVLSPVVGGLLVDAFSWRSMFLINLPLGVLTIVVAARYLPLDQDRERDPRPFDLPGAALFACALLALNYGVTRAQEDGWLHRTVLLLLGSAVLLLVLFTIRELRCEAPVLDLRLLTRRSFLGISLTAVINRFITGGSMVYFMLYLQQGHGYSPLRTGLLLFPLGFASMAGAIVAGKLQARFSAGGVLGGGGILLAGSSLVFMWQIGDLHDPLWLIPASMVWGVGNSLVNTPLMNVATNAVPIDRVGMATGLLNSFFPIGASVGTVVLGTVFTGVLSGAHATPLAALGAATGALYAIVAGLALVGALLAWLMIRPEGRTAPEVG
ncbi:MFS transporter [Corynebacterium sp. P7003]|uniref:MFS transporter n=1 Tax=Corynebacterium pygosceleis TaxID=2800406 RepID=A0ABT3WX01_9CORY|nr:MFS transporter [Corynebacterium pygosceleis]MCX7445745.1 MFS transporter [Corynebacterium pygosceleis]